MMSRKGLGMAAVYVASRSDVVEELGHARLVGRAPRFVRWALEGADLSGLNLEGASFEGAGLHRAVFSGANCRGAVFDGVDGRRSVFDGADCSGASFAGAWLGWASFREGVLRAADLSHGLLHGACLEGADLAGADLTKAALGMEVAGDLREVLLDTRGLSLGCLAHWGPGELEARAAWKELLPEDPGVRGLVVSLLDDWEGTLREAIATAELLAAA